MRLLQKITFFDFRKDYTPAKTQESSTSQKVYTCRFSAHFVHGQQKSACFRKRFS